MKSFLLVCIIMYVTFASAGAEIVKSLTAVRLENNPIITTKTDGAGDNINGPSLIKVPDWLPNPKGTYYLYFAHHHGRCPPEHISNETNNRIPSNI